MECGHEETIHRRTEPPDFCAKRRQACPLPSHADHQPLVVLTRESAGDKLLGGAFGRSSPGLLIWTCSIRPSRCGGAVHTFLSSRKRGPLPFSPASSSGLYSLQRSNDRQPQPMQLSS